MRKERQFKAGRCYHLAGLLMRVECFSGARVIGWCVMSNRYLVPLMAKGLIRQTLPEKPKSRFQRYALA